MTLLEAMRQRATVVAASTRLARHLRWRYDSSQAAAGKNAWPAADIVSWSAWIDRLYRLAATDSGPVGGVAPLTIAQTRLLWREIIATHPVRSVSPTDLVSMSRAVLSAWQLARGWQIPLESIREASRSADTDAFAAWAAEFDSRCRDQCWIDQWSLPDLLIAEAGAGRLKLEKTVYLAGFDEPTPQQAALFSAIPSVELIEEDIADALARRVECSDPEQERVLAARWARDMLEKRDASVIGIVLPDLAGQAEAYRRTLLDALAPDWRSRAVADLPVNSAFARPLSQVGLIRIGLLVLKAASGRLDYRELGELLRTPYLGGAQRESSHRATADIRLRRDRRQDIDLRTFGASAESTPLFSSLIGAALEWGAKNDRHTSAAQWTGAFAGLLKNAGWLGDRPLNSDEYQALKAWRKLIESFSLAGRIAGALKRDGAIALLEELARERTFQPEGRMDGVQIMAPEDAAGHRFDGLWIAGLSDDCWPPAAKPNPLIPFELQQRFDVPGSSPQRVREAAMRMTHQLAASAPEVYASWPRQRNQESLVGSPLLPADAIDPNSIPQYAGGTHREQVFSSCTRPDRLEADPVPPVPGAMATRGGSQLLKFQAACPARAFFEFRLGAREMDAPVYGIDPLLRGNIMHDALERLYGEISAEGGIADLDQNSLDQMIGRAINRSLRKHIPRRHPLAATLSTNEERRMNKLLNALIEIDRARPGFAIASVESSDSATVGAIELTLRQDRVDRVSGDRRLVIDYKTSAKFSTGGWIGMRLSEPQLPLYAATGDAQGIAIVLLNQDGVKYVGVGDGEVAAAVDGIKTAGTFTGVDETDWTSLVEDWKRALDGLAGEYVAGDCRMDRGDTKFAEGEFAMLTRVFSDPGDV